MVHRYIPLEGTYDDIHQNFLQVQKCLLIIFANYSGKSYERFFLMIFPYRYMSILGWLVNISSLSNLVPEVLVHQKFLLTYKLSQDHLELFFSAVRGAGTSLYTDFFHI